MKIIDTQSIHEHNFVQRSHLTQPLSNSDLVNHILRIHLASNCVSIVMLFLQL